MSLSSVVCLLLYHGNQGWRGETERNQTQGKVAVKLNSNVALIADEKWT